MLFQFCSDAVAIAATLLVCVIDGSRSPIASQQS